ncbi:NADH-quinone oxidoreductase subunit NuoE family protein [Desulfoluna spongiiphila]|uniref:NADH dehydrogenase subunit E n=1 Tax=Desulfoluna spongiiphila TaxID=419481 RepID=A0A1G5E3H6_9BACT|nr:NAD(P)H-dependent oxidoreductase subunit E [Desulfoluna spongiiphila]SCY21554.1 NADH dehydrogenase subunit E [Desulfoluna spongiiphila]VVS91574.1 nadh-quinone oxidoreductase subunit e-like [Desulfoluna spongiiphila]
MAMDHHPEHPDITAEMWPRIDTIIDENSAVPGSLITVLRLCQDTVGYLPPILLDYIAQGLGLASSQVFGVATFYSLFSLKPKGRNIIKACTGTACYVKGIKEVMNHIGNKYGLSEGETMEDRRFTLEGVRCLGACGLAPVMIVNEDIHGNVDPKDVTGILEEYQ